jgi:hypothetical protein
MSKDSVFVFACSVSSGQLLSTLTDNQSFRLRGFNRLANYPAQFENLKQFSVDNSIQLFSPTL